ncbi:hypothetical protein AgCh_034194 [Apium graveolens]
MPIWAQSNGFSSRFKCWIIKKVSFMNTKGVKVQGGAVSHSPAMQEFKNCINMIEVQDVNYTGIQYSWTGVPNGSGIVKNMDRVIANLFFFQKFAGVKVNFLPRGVSDHSPKLHRLKKVFRTESWKGGDLRAKGDLLKARLVDVQVQLDSDPFDVDLRALEASLSREYRANRLEEERLWKQKAKDFVIRVDSFAASDMTREVSKEEIKVVIFAMGDDKASGPDGYSALFFKKAWPIIGEDVCGDVLDFFRTGKLLKEVNATFIALIPKSDHPIVVREYKPIALCNVLYKCITKIIANQIKGCLGNLVDDTQNAFIPGHHISDNILLTQEIMKNYHRRVGSPRCAMKVDIKKAYDSVSWEFLIDALRLFGFLDKMIGWIRECISMSAYSVIINGQMHDFFRGEKGIRQGDPLSPYLFTLVMQVFSLMLKRRISEGGAFKYHPKCAKLGITHLSFVDDLLLFSAADPFSVQILKDSLDEFGSCSGLWPNNAKSNIFSDNVPYDSKVLIHGILDFNVGSLPLRYLGVPLISTRLWVNDCKSLIQKVRDKIDSWENDWLNYAGRVQLASSVLLSLQVYWGSIFILPITVTNRIEKLIRNFIWGGKGDSKGKAKNIVSHKCSLWVKWVHEFRIQNRSFWDIKVAWDASWSWKNILGLREEIRPFIKSVLGNGQSINFWFDNWVLNQPLANFYNHRAIAGMGLSLFAKPADFSIDGLVVWPVELLERIPQLNEFISRIDVAWNDKTLHNLINKLVLAASVAHLWHERNKRIFQSKRKREWQIIDDIEDAVQKKLMGMEFGYNHRVCEELTDWRVSFELPSIQRKLWILLTGVLK